jgi:exonuclease III
MRSQQKFNQLAAEVNCLKPNLICITESWLDDESSLDSYRLDGYTHLCSNRSSKQGGGVIMYISNSISSVQHAISTAVNDAYNVCSAVIHAQAAKILVITVYRAPWASVADTISFCDLLDDLISKHPNLIMVGDFNLPGVQWSADSTPDKGASAQHIHNLNT